MRRKEFVINVSILSILIVIAAMLNYVDNKRYNSAKTTVDSQISDVAVVTELANEISTPEVPSVDAAAVTDPIVYDGMTLNELAAKLNKSLHSDLTGTGYLFAKYSIAYGVDPYLAVAISLHETGCGSTCSEKVTICNNVGGQKFSPSCFAGGSYGKYATLEEGIEGFISNLGINYIQKGMTTAVSMQYRYTGKTNSTWASKVNNYIAKIKSA